jgi:hypothetical protein
MNDRLPGVLSKEDGVDYEKLRLILQRQYGRPVSLKEAVGTGKYLLNVYEILLDNRGDNGKIKEHTTQPKGFFISAL